MITDLPLSAEENYKMSRALPGPSGNSFWQLAQFRADPYGYLERCHEQYGEIFILRLPGQPPFHVVSGPEEIKQIMGLGHHEAERLSGAEALLSPLSLILLQGSAHRQKRRQMNPSLSMERIRSYGPAIAETTEQFLDTWNPVRTAPMNLRKKMQELTVRVIVRCVFGVRDWERAARLSALVIDFINGMFSLEMLLVNVAIGTARLHQLFDILADAVERLPPMLRGAERRVPLVHLAHTRRQTYNIIDQQIAQAAVRTEDNRDSILTQLACSQTPDGAQMTGEDLRAQLVTLLVTGQETLATALCWAMHCLMMNPGALSRLRAELQDAKGPGDSVSPDRVRKLPYLDAVIMESMRLFPIFPVTARQLLQPRVVAGYALEAGSIVWASISLSHRDSARWPSPSRFLPERMLDQKVSMVQFFPFGLGAWRCIGAAFAEHEMRVVLAQMLSRFDFTPASSSQVKPRLRWMTVTPSNDLPVRITARMKSSAGPTEPLSY